MDSYRIFSPELDHSPSITGYYSPTSMAFRPSIGSYGNSYGAVHRQGPILSGVGVGGLVVEGTSGIMDIPSNLGLNASTALTVIGAGLMAYSTLGMKGKIKLKGSKKDKLKTASVALSAASLVAGLYGLAS